MRQPIWPPRWGRWSMNGNVKNTAGLLFGLSCMTQACSQIVLRPFDVPRKHDSDNMPVSGRRVSDRRFTGTGKRHPFRRLRSAMAAERHNNQQLPCSRLGELTRRCAPAFSTVGDTQPPSKRQRSVTKMSFFCPRDVTIVCEGVVAF